VPVVAATTRAVGRTAIARLLWRLLTGGWGALRSLGHRAIGWVVAEPWIVVLVLGSAVVNSFYAVVRHEHFDSGFDLGIFTQAVWHYSQFQAPVSSVEGTTNLLGDHFHPILILLAPLFWVWADARTLLIAQAALVAASIVPVYLFARPRLGRPAAHLLALAYASFWGLAVGTGYEFHEVAFAPLLIALVILFIDRRQWVAYFVGLGLLLCVKEDLSVLVCFLGLYLLTLREDRRGLITLVAGVAWYELTTRVLIPHFAHGATFAYWTYPQFGHNIGEAFVQVLRAPWKPLAVAVDDPQKAQTMLYLFLPFLGLTLGSRIALLTLPLLAERFLSSNSQFWGPSFHYSMAIAPVLAMGAAVGLKNITRLFATRLEPGLLTAGAAAMVISGLLVAAVIPGEPLRRMVRPSFYRAPPFSSAVRHALDHVPPHAPVLAPDFLVAHLATRAATYELDPHTGNVPGAYLITGLVQQVGNLHEYKSYRAYQQDVERRLPLYEPAFYEDGWMVLRLRPRGINSGTNGILRPLPRAPANQLLHTYFAWQATLTQTAIRLLECGVPQKRNEPTATACYSHTGPSFFAAEALLDRQLSTVLSGVTGGCLSLGDLARMAASQVAADIQRFHGAGIRQAAAALQSSAHDINDLDLPGRLARFMILCYPRPLPTSSHAPTAVRGPDKATRPRPTPLGQALKHEPPGRPATTSPPSR